MHTTNSNDIGINILCCVANFYLGLCIPKKYEAVNLVMQGRGVFFFFFFSSATDQQIREKKKNMWGNDTCCCHKTK